MILEAASEVGAYLTKSFMLGDRESDVEAGRAAGCATVFIDLGYALPPPVLPTTSRVRSPKRPTSPSKPF